MRVEGWPGEDVLSTTREINNAEDGGDFDALA
jgi:hypothetical protein